MGSSPKDKEEKTRKKPGRVPTSCAECRRLKLRCDKNVPCGKCVSRGCGSICPDGHLTSGKGNRLVLANTEELHNRIEHLCSRIRDLEDALRTLQETVSDRPHPLLRTDLLHIKAIPYPMQPASEGTSSSSSDSRNSASSTLASDEIPDPAQRTEEENFIDAFGTLTIGLHGESSFLGQTARSEYLFRALAKTQPSPTVLPPRLSRRIIESSFPDSDVFDDELGREVFELLPPLSEAIRLCDMYLEHSPYLPIALMRTELIDEILETVYRAGTFESLRNHHALSLLFVVFAIATILDPSKHPYSIEAQEFYYLSRAALSLASPVRETTRAAIQALIHMAQYRDLSDWEGTGSGAAWIYIGTAVRLAHGIGLHLDSSRWNLSEEASDRRSRLFWQLFGYDTWLSFSLGRPPSMSLNFIDASYPKDLCGPEISPGGESGKELSYALWTAKYSVLMHSIMSTAFGCKVPSYNTILELDRKVRDFYIPVHIRPNCTPENPPPTPYHQMQRLLTLSTKESTLLNLHRAYFAQALQDKPDDLANHRFIPSVMAAYRSAWRLIRGLVIAWRDIPLLLSRYGSAWSPALSAAIVMCILVTRAPTSKMTKSSLEELDALARLFQDASSSCRFAANLLKPILVLARRAHQAVDDTYPHPEVCDVTPADLDRLGGKTHLISQLSNVTAKGDTPSPPTTYNRPSTDLSDMVATNSETMHPTIAQDMRSFDLGEPSQFYDTFPEAEMAGIQFTGDSIFSIQTGGYGYSPLPAFHSPPVGGYAGGPPMLDATWQSFVEQLGF
ncbi:Zn(2)-C6 fungal-type domain-containing protein [Mycena venus]|uniref:Zn(2)-C6 fungal-type domain-containing protein n=1 Tax=Mycena venus TaxID=2733690 RepID=A0A8H6XUZ3_9AGAR|nr:Zn(2)-C6 fungal-type domain-containing protein [Mycena venus]